MLKKWIDRFFPSRFWDKSSQINAPPDKQIFLEDYRSLSLDALIKTLKTSPEGLTRQEASQRLVQFGLNELNRDRPPSWYMLLLKNFLNPFVLLLLFLAFISFFLEDLEATVIILCMVVISILMRFVQEFRSYKAAEKLEALVSTKATVLRKKNKNCPPEKQEIDLKLLVPGDIVYLSSGDMVPADVRLIESKELYVSQSTLTGESLPVEKHLQENSSAQGLLETPFLCFMGTNVLNGAGHAVILKTGNQTYLGSITQEMMGYRALTSFDIGINKVSWLLIRFMFVMVPFVFFLNGYTKGDWFEALLFALSVAVGLTPEMLPMIVTANLAKGALNMSQKMVIVKQLNAIQNFGAMDILCTDKTGTLTQDRVILIQHVDIQGNESQEVLHFAYLNSYYQTGLKNLLDIAVLEHAETKKISHPDKTYKKYDEIPFDFTRRRMSVIVEKNSHEHLLVCKGAVEEVLEVCHQVFLNGSLVPLNSELKAEVEALVKKLNEEGMRVLAVAYKKIPVEIHKEYLVPDEKELSLMGLLAFLDPPKSTAAEALVKLHQNQVKVKILTGDSEWVTRKICKWVNLEDKNYLTGKDIDLLNDLELRNKVDEVVIFARLTPLQKSRIIRALKANNHTVGYLGDGINDAPALREADIGISVDTAVDIAKESADIIMLKKSLLFLSEGVLEGRRTFGNIMKYIKMTVSSNFGNVLSVVGASALFPFLPMLPIQLLIQNLLYDISQVVIPFDDVDNEFLIKPRPWNPQGIARFMLFIGPISSIFDYTTFALMWYVFAANTVERQSLFQSGWFVEGLLSQTLIVHMIRTQKIPFIQSHASFPLLVATGMVMAIGIYLPYSFIGAKIGLVPLPWIYFPWLMITLLGYCLFTQVAKILFIKKFGYWL
ncbi:MAG: magnesium-translocating P-type ATPase [Chlamydiales bacterium]|nr:magnesium-translocating P-type ATPase [Chlamydiales bacterium]